MLSLYYELDAEAELDALWKSDEDAAALIEELLWQFEESPALLDELCKEKRHVTHAPSFEVKRFQHMWQRGYTVYTLKIWPDGGSAISYRVLYAHHPQKDAYHVLAVMQRDLDYDADKALIDRIIAACEAIGIPCYR